jgi:3-oxoacyl-[acyl-carrier-protein] synthase-3
MRYQRACLESIGYAVPDEVLTSDDLEKRLGPLYQRLKLPAGRLELITGIDERRVWPKHSMPGDVSIETGELAIEAAEIDRREIGVLIHASVCRDHLEPATACRVHHGLRLGKRCLVFDLSNACLGLMNAVQQVANMIELRQIRAGLVVGTEDSRSLLETTIDLLNRDDSLTRSTIKGALASLTIGSGSCALLVVDESLSRTGNRIHTITVRAETDHHRLCRSGRDEAADGMSPLMQTDSETLMRVGIQAGEMTFADFLAESEWARDSINKTVCHQVGETHRRLMLESLKIPLERDYATLRWLGNTGSVAMPVTMGIACQQGHIQRGDRVAMLGIGSGINCLMTALTWQKSRVRGKGPVP